MGCPHCGSSSTQPVDRRRLDTEAGHWRCLACGASWPDECGAAPARADDTVAGVVRRVEGRRRLDPDALAALDALDALEDFDGLDALDEPGSLFDARSDL